MAKDEDLKSLLKDSLTEEFTASPAATEKGSSADILRIAVIGGGTMGQGIAQVASQAGIDVLLIEKDEVGLQASKAAIEDKLDWEISRWAKTVSDKKAILSRIRGSVEISDVAEYPIVIEALPENLEIKKSMFATLDEICQPETIFVTNTSTLSITETATATQRKSQVIDMHFLYPVPKTAVVEVVRGLKTSDATVSRIRRFAVQLNKTPIEVYEYPGYVTTRVILPMLKIAGLGVAFRAKPVVRASAGHSISTLGLDGILYLLGLRDRELTLLLDSADLDDDATALAVE